MTLIVDPQGGVSAIYSEAIDLASLGTVSIRRASYVEPDDQGRWWADLSPVNGPKLGPFALRSLTLAAEQSWLEALLAGSAGQYLDFNAICVHYLPKELSWV